MAIHWLITNINSYRVKNSTKEGGWGGEGVKIYAFFKKHFTKGFVLVCLTKGHYFVLEIGCLAFSSFAENILAKDK